MLGRTGVFLSNDPKDFKKGFAELNEKLVSIADGRYVLSYCSTKKKGQHKLEIEIETPGGEAKVSHKFNAAGFNPSRCSPKTKPLFEEIEALKADAAEKQKVIEAKEKEKEAAEAEAALAAIKDPGGKEKGRPRKESPRPAAKEPAKSGEAPPRSPRRRWRSPRKEPAKAAPAPAAAKEPSQLDSRPPRPRLPSRGRRRNRSSTRSNGPPGAPSPRCAARFPSSAGPPGGGRGTYWLGLVTKSCDAARFVR